MPGTAHGALEYTLHVPTYSCTAGSGLALGCLINWWMDGCDSCVMPVHGVQAVVSVKVIRQDHTLATLCLPLRCGLVPSCRCRLVRGLVGDAAIGKAARCRGHVCCLLLLSLRGPLTPCRYSAATAATSLRLQLGLHSVGRSAPSVSVEGWRGGQGQGAEGSDGGRVGLA